MSNSAFLTETPRAPYARVRVRGDRQVHRLALPFTVGSSPLCDVIVNVPGLAPVGRLVTEQDGRLLVTTDRGQPLPLPGALADLGIQVSGPIAGRAAQSNVKTWLLELAATERDLFAKAPRALQTLSGGSLSQRRRLAAWGVASAAVVMAVGIATSLPGAASDLSQSPIAMTAGTLHTGTVGSSKSRAGYERGATFTVTLPGHGGVTGTQLLTMEVGGLSDAEELTLMVNGQTTAVWSAEADCVETFCQKTVRLGQEVLVGGLNTLQFVHRGDSAYLIRKLLITPLPVLTAAEHASVDTWLAAARRAYTDRHILADNLVEAHRLLKRAAQLLATRDLPTEPARSAQGEVRALTGDVEAELTGAVRDLWFKAEKHARLREREAAERTLATLQRLFPDPKDPAHVRAEAMRKSLEEMEP